MLTCNYYNKISGNNQLPNILVSINGEIGLISYNFGHFN